LWKWSRITEFVFLKLYKFLFIKFMLEFFISQAQKCVVLFNIFSFSSNRNIILFSCVYSGLHVAHIYHKTLGLIMFCWDVFIRNRVIMLKENIMLILMHTSVACAVGPSLTTFSTDFSFQNLVYLNFQG
jgi:hypothetical protein